MSEPAWVIWPIRSSWAGHNFPGHLDALLLHGPPPKFHCVIKCTIWMWWINLMPQLRATMMRWRNFWQEFFVVSFAKLKRQEIHDPSTKYFSIRAALVTATLVQRGPLLRDRFPTGRPRPGPMQPGRPHGCLPTLQMPDWLEILPPLLYACGPSDSIELVLSSTRVTSAKFHKYVLTVTIDRPEPVDWTPGPGDLGPPVTRIYIVFIKIAC